MLFRYLTILMCLGLLSRAASAQPATSLPKAKVLVGGLKISQFYANTYSVDELAFINDSTGLTKENASRVIRTYSDEVIEALTNYASDAYQFVPLDSSVVSRIHSRSQYADWQNVFKESYTSLVADSVLDGQLRATMAAHQADYFLSLNFYEIAANYYPLYLTPYLKARHAIDYEILDRNLAVVAAGRVTLVSKDVRATSMEVAYRQFAEEVVQRLTIALTSPDLATAKRQLKRLAERKISNAWAAGISLGWGAPYSWFGVELVRSLGPGLDAGAGIGFGPSGFKAGAGVRAYLLNYGQKFNPFLAAHVAWGSGFTFDVGGEEDEDGNQLNQEDVSTFAIPSGAAVHLKTGFRWLSGNRAFLLGVGYGIPFSRYEATVTGKQTPQRQRTANLFTIGGFEAGFTYLYYLGN